MMMMKSVFWWRKPEYPETTDLRQVGNGRNVPLSKCTLVEGFYNFSDICVPVDLFTPSLYKFDVTGKNIEDDHTMDHEHTKKIFYLQMNIF